MDMGYEGVDDCKSEEENDMISETDYYSVDAKQTNIRKEMSLDDEDIKEDAQNENLERNDLKNICKENSDSLSVESKNFNDSLSVESKLFNDSLSIESKNFSDSPSIESKHLDSLEEENRKVKANLLKEITTTFSRLNSQNLGDNNNNNNTGSLDQEPGEIDFNNETDPSELARMWAGADVIDPANELIDEPCSSSSSKRHISEVTNNSDGTHVAKRQKLNDPDTVFDAQDVYLDKPGGLKRHISQISAASEENPATKRQKPNEEGSRDEDSEDPDNPMPQWFAEYPDKYRAPILNSLKKLGKTTREKRIEHLVDNFRVQRGWPEQLVDYLDRKEAKNRNTTKNIAKQNDATSGDAMLARTLQEQEKQNLAKSLQNRSVLVSGGTSSSDLARTLKLVTEQERLLMNSKQIVHNNVDVETHFTKHFDNHSEVDPWGFNISFFTGTYDQLILTKVFGGQAKKHELRRKDRIVAMGGIDATKENYEEFKKKLTEGKATTITFVRMEKKWECGACTVNNEYHERFCTSCGISRAPGEQPYHSPLVTRNSDNCIALVLRSSTKKELPISTDT